MLILYRSESQSFFLGDDIEVKILDIFQQFDKVKKTYKNVARLGIKAPDQLQIWRNEIYRKIRSEKNLKEANECL
jgi:carbon storage regulator CsrA